MSRFIFADFDKDIDFVYTENNIFLLKELKIINSTGSAWSDIKITMSATPEFIKPQTWILEKIMPDSEKSLSDCIITKDTKFLQALTKDTEAEIKFTLETDFSVIDEHIEKVMLPAYNAEKDNSLKAKSLTRLDIWQKKLLNLSPSNPLLNCKINKTNIPVLCTNPGKLEDYLADGQKITLVSAEKVFGEKVSQELRSLAGCEKSLFDKAEKALLAKQMPVNIPEDKIKPQTIALYRKTKSILEEGGSNTLYLAIGFLNITPEKKTGKKYHAPLVLCPVKLERVTVQSGVKLSAHEDESRFNTTLLELLKQDFGISIPSLEGELPTDESGLDVFEITNRVKNAVKDMPGFEVTDETVLGHFSFNKYLMWKDLIDRKDEIIRHPVIAAITDKDKKFDDNIDIITPENLDKEYKPGDFYTPLAADSSQLAIIASADKGKSFVIEGPPGTGKSQTISNLIAHLIAKGKKVLFVSEKMAALEVVYKRLEKIGLGNYCLEIHSNKANKKDVLNKLSKSWEGADTNYRDFRSLKSEEAAKYLKEINKYAKELHKPLGNGITPYEAMANYIANKDKATNITLSWDKSVINSAEDFENLKNCVHDIRVQAENCPEIFDSSVFSCMTIKKCTPDTQKEIVETLEKIVEYTEKSVSTAKETIKYSGLNINIEDTSNLSLISDLVKLLKNPLSSSLYFLFEEDSNITEQKLKDGIKCLKAYNSEIAKLKFEYAPNIWNEIDAKLFLHRWEVAKKSFFIKAYFEKKKIEKEIKEYGINGEIKLPEDLIKLKNIHEYSNRLNTLNKELIKVPVWNGDSTKFEKVNELFTLKEKLIQLIDDIGKLSGGSEKVKTIFKEILTPQNLRKDGDFYKNISTFKENHSQTEELLDKFKKLCDPEREGRDLYKSRKSEPVTVEILKEYLNLLKTKPILIKENCHWNKIKENAKKLNLKPLTGAIERHTINYSEIESTFTSAYYAWLSRTIMTENSLFGEFSSAKYEDMISCYKNCDNDVQELSVRYIIAKLSEGIPDKKSADLTKEWKFLQREMNKQRQIKPVRQIIENAKDAVQKLTPCFMMSPLSVAQYLPVSQDMFDTVIFDEASQITVWDAIGTLSRGKQIIVAGDPKQMPPSNFFGRTIEYDEDETGLEEDLESILDELTGSGIPTLRLNWHYRSRCESLIAFSNKKYYDNTLVTFPASHTKQKSVQFRPVPGGIYEKGVRVNKKEAMMLVKECIARLTSTKPEIRNKSIGIVTFNSDQQKLIEDMLDKAREAYPETEFAFSPENPEPVFVKNLETVQGDERDVILFSITYGSDKDGKISMNFGPLNRLGGERRLNVAFTRSKYETVIFSSLMPEQIDLSKTSSKGVADLKDFLTYAKTGEIGNEKENEETASLFEKATAEKLMKKGWKVKTKVGKSSLKADFAIVDPENPDEFLAGIIIDGDIYKNAATASDRVKIFPAALENLGWELIKIHIPDLWNDEVSTLGKLNNTLYKLYERNKKTKKV